MLRPLLLLLLLATPRAHGQTDPASLQQTLRGKQFHLRNYSADAVAHYTWANGGLTSPPPQLRTFGIFLPTTVTFKDQLLTITGDSATLVRDSKTGTVGMSGHLPMFLRIDLGQSSDVLPQLTDQLFFPDAASAHAALPPYLIESLPLVINGHSTPPACKCGWIRQNGKWLLNDHPVTAPRLLHYDDPQFTEQARAHKMHGHTSYWLLIAEKGQPEDIWLAQSLGDGLDQEGLKALRTYRFSPAKLDGQPVAAPMLVEINFDID